MDKYIETPLTKVEIDTDGKTYTVENEAGKGFINHALKGSLKIIM